MATYGLILTTYNRPEYLRECIKSLKASELYKYDVKVIVVDDCSDNQETKELLQYFNVGAPWELIKKDKRAGVYDSLQIGYNLAFTGGCDVAMNMDADAIVRTDFMAVILGMQKKFPDQIVTGFNCLTKNADGTDRHFIFTEHDGHNTKKSVGGINMCVDNETYFKYIRPALFECIEKGGNWDHKACINSMADGKPIVCCVPSVIQHIGFDSSMNHTEEPDTAADFKPLRLTGVQLICVDCVDLSRALAAVDKSCEHIAYDEVTVLSSIPSSDPRVKLIPGLHSKQAYSHFMVKELHKYITSDHVLVIQYDGYVMNYKAWDNNWLNFDYIGATWWFNDGMNVGNGGFSLRSKKLHHIIAHDVTITKTHPEDEIICRTYRKHLEMYGLKWAEDKDAKRFSIEGYKQEDKQYKDQFGFHGTIVKFQEHIESKNVIIINQFFGLGDILFCIPIARDFIKKGHKVLWPVYSHYANINKHFPDITFVDKDLVNIDYELEEEHTGNGYTVIPMRFTHRIAKVGMRECMKVKYTHVGENWERWRELTWTRDEKAEALLFKKLGIQEGEEYCLVNTVFRSSNHAKVPIKPRTKLKVVNMETIEGFTLLDWAKVIEQATEIHTVSTAIIYMMEVMKLKAKEVCIYKRQPDELTHDNYSYILTSVNNYKLMP